MSWTLHSVRCVATRLYPLAMPSAPQRLVANLIVMSHAVPPRLRVRLLRALGFDVHRQSEIRSRTLVKTSELHVGEGSFINHNCFIDAGTLTIGRNVYVGPGVTFMMGDHEMGRADKRAGKDKNSPIAVEDGAWIGANVTILGGTTIAAGCVVAAGAVLTKSTQPNGLYAGIPARRLKDLPVN
jgi:maltose O-acetyltransferase